MEGTFVFDGVNNIIYKKLNDALKMKINDIALGLELIDPGSNKDIDSPHISVLIQLFSPIIASQKILCSQFDNTYTFFQCEKNQINLVFDEFLGYTFLKIGSDSILKLRRSLKISISFARRICGPNIFLLKSDDVKQKLFKDVVSTWESMYPCNAGVLLEIVEHLLINSDLQVFAQKTLELATKKLQREPDSKRSHAIIFVDNKLFGRFSSTQAQKISSSDILFLSIFCNTLRSRISSKSLNIQSHLIFLEGCCADPHTSCIPYIVHTSILDKGTVLLLLLENGNYQIANNLHNVFFTLQSIKTMQIQNDLDNLRVAYDNLEYDVKQTLDTMKKMRNNTGAVDCTLKKFSVKWDILRKKYLDYFKSSEKELIVKIESNLPAFSEELKSFFKVACIDVKPLDKDIETVLEISTFVEERLLEFSEFLNVKAQRNLSITAYIEDFPGLVHFMHLDRTNGKMIAPDLSGGVQLISNKNVWSMVEFSRSYISKGYTSLVWKDTAFNYSYFLWCEDQNGTPIQPRDRPNLSAARSSFEPGILAGDFYRRVFEVCFPKTSWGDIRCYELYCIHLGLVTMTCALEHCRRICATINEVVGNKKSEYF